MTRFQHWIGDVWKNSKLSHEKGGMVLRTVHARDTMFESLLPILGFSSHADWQPFHALLWLHLNFRVK